MKIALIGATGWIGCHVLREACERGHEVTAVLRDSSRVESVGPAVGTAVADVKDCGALQDAIEGKDAVVSAYRAPAEQPQDLVVAARAVIAAVRGAGVPRLVWVGSTATLKLPGTDTDLVDLPQFPADWKRSGFAHRDSLRLFRDEGDGLGWTYISVPRTIEDGERTGTYRLGGDEPLFDDEGQSRISTEDFAVAIVDSLERGDHAGQRITVAY